MTFLPIVERELRVGARRSSTYWIRFSAALCVLVIWLALVMGSRGIATAALSQHLFTAFGVITLGFCLVAGIFLTADCLSEEKREGTLGLLFLTDLRGYDVVLGKLIGTSIQSANGLLAVLPILGLPLLMGGVTRGEFWRVILVMLTTLFFSLSLGMVVSAFNREARQAMAGTFLGLLVLTGLFPAIWWLAFVLHIALPATISLSPSPAHLFTAAFDHHYGTRNGPQEFWTSLLIVFSLGLGFLIGAAILLPRTWHEGKLAWQPNTRGGRRSVFGGCAGWAASAWDAMRTVIVKRAFWAGFTGLLFGMVLALFIVRSALFVEYSLRWVPLLLFAGFGYLGVVVALRGIKARLSPAQRKHLLEENPFFWLATRDGLSRALVWGMVSLLAVLWVCFFAAALIWKSQPSFVLCLITAYALHQVFKLMVGLEATRQMCEARRNGSLELLLISPLKESKIIEGQEQALKAHFAGVQRFILIINLCLCAGVVLFRNALSMGNSRDQAMFLELFLGGILMLLLDFRALGAVGMLMGLRDQRQNRALLATFSRVMVLPWFAIFFLMFLGTSGALNGTQPGPVFAVWFAVGIVTDLSMAAQARAMLSRGIRECLNKKLFTFRSPGHDRHLRVPYPAPSTSELSA